jgi:hypothetical protein
MNILAYFSNNGVPATGLIIPTIKIREVPAGTLLVNGSSMTEVGDGFYTYNFTTYDADKDYAIVCDGTAALSDSDRYTYAGNENYIDDIENSNLSTQILGVSASVDDLSTLVSVLPTGSSLSVQEIVDGVWDEPLTGATHNVPRSAGRRLRQLSDVVITDGTAVGAGNGINQIELNGDAFTTDGAYDPAMVAIVEGTGSGQCRNILEYDGATKIATVDRNWKVAPDNTSEYIIYADSGREHVNEGLIRGATYNTVTLNAYASSADNMYRGQILFIRSGRGDDQSCIVAEYDGTTKVATLEHPWKVIPDTTSAYVMLPQKLYPETVFRNMVWNTPTSGYTDTNTIGGTINNINTNTEAISAAVMENQDYLKRIIGLVHENIFIDNPVYDGDGNLTSARLRIYSNPSDVGTANNVIGTYQITAPGDGAGRFTSWKQVRV